MSKTQRLIEQLSQDGLKNGQLWVLPYRFFLRQQYYNDGSNQESWTIINMYTYSSEVTTKHVKIAVKQFNLFIETNTITGNLYVNFCACHLCGDNQFQEILNLRDKLAALPNVDEIIINVGGNDFSRIKLDNGAYQKRSVAGIYFGEKNQQGDSGMSFGAEEQDSDFEDSNEFVTECTIDYNKNVDGNDFSQLKMDDSTYQGQLAGIYLGTKGQDGNTKSPYTRLTNANKEAIRGNFNVHNDKCEHKEKQKEQDVSGNQEQQDHQDYSKKIKALNHINNLVQAGRTIHIGWETYKDPSNENLLRFGLYAAKTIVIGVNYFGMSNYWLNAVSNVIMWLPTFYSFYESLYEIYEYYYSGKASHYAALKSHLQTMLLSAVSNLPITKQAIAKNGKSAVFLTIAYLVATKNRQAAEFYIHAVLTIWNIDGFLYEVSGVSVIGYILSRMGYGNEFYTNFDKIIIKDSHQSNFTLAASMNTTAPLLPENAVKKVNLCNITQDYMHNLPGFADNMMEQLDIICFDSDRNDIINGCKYTSVNSTDAAGVIVEETYGFLDINGNCNAIA